MVLPKENSPFFNMAQRMGFEPMVPLRGTHDFQSCSFDRSDISAETCAESVPRSRRMI